MPLLGVESFQSERESRQKTVVRNGLLRARVVVVTAKLKDLYDCEKEKNRCDVLCFVIVKGNRVEIGAVPPAKPLEKFLLWRTACLGLRKGVIRDRCLVHEELDYFLDLFPVDGLVLLARYFH
jgi:hypothetical protein